MSHASSVAAAPRQFTDEYAMAAAALDQSLDMIVVVDGDGTIILTNAAWRVSASGHQCARSAVDCGVNYLDVCARGDAAVVADGIRAVLVGDRTRFEFEYPCHSPTEEAWFALEVTPLGASMPGAVLTHTNITARVANDRNRALGQRIDPVTMLAAAPAGVPGLARMLADAQTQQSALAVVSVTLSNLVEVESVHGRRTRDDLIVQAVARIRRLTRADDLMIRPSTNQLTLFAKVADARGGEFLRDRIAEALDANYLVGPFEIRSHVGVDVVSSDQFSTLDSLLHAFRQEPAPVPQRAREARPRALDLQADNDETDDYDAPDAPLMVFSLPDGALQSANQPAQVLFGPAKLQPGELHARDLSGPTDRRRLDIALSALSSGATESYRADRTLMTTDGPLAMKISARRLLVSSVALAAVSTVPADASDTTSPTADDPLDTALVAGTIDAAGAITSLSSAISPMEAELLAALTVSLTLATHPGDVGVVDAMLESLRRNGSAAGTVRLPHSDLGWVQCQYQVFTLKRRTAAASGDGLRCVDRQMYAFVLSASLGRRSMVDKIARLERHIRRIGSEVRAADVALTQAPDLARGVNTLLDKLDLTKRQRDILERLIQGQRVGSISAALYISPSTVRNHLAHIYRRVGVHSQEALLVAVRAGRA